MFAASTAYSATSVTPWVPIFQGIEQATGTNSAATFGTLSVHALRIDLQNPDVKLLLTPPVTNNYTPNVRETLMRTPSEFLVEHGLQVAVNAVHFSPPGYQNPSGTPAYLTGVAVSEGRVVSAQSGIVESESAMLFTTNNEATFLPLNWPAASTEGIFTAFAGMYPLVSNGVNIAYAYTNPPVSEIHTQQPRTAFGLSEGRRYLILMAIDGRQNFSDGALDWETADLLLLFGAWDGMNMDGGGSTCMVKANYCGDPIAINQNSFQFTPGQRLGAQRPVGCNLGVRAKPLPEPIQDLSIETGATTAMFTWRTETPTTTQVEYGLTQDYGSSTPLDSRLTRNHVANLYGLQTGSNYYFRAISQAGFDQYTVACRVRPTPAPAIRTLVFDVTNSWTYTTNNLDGVNWKAPGYDDSGWLGSGAGLLHADNSTLSAPKNTLLPPGIVPTGSPFPRTFYFRSRFTFAGSTTGLSLVFSNYVDDGAVFYLNGTEIQRLRMQAAPAVITNLSIASGAPCPPSNDATCPDVFTVSGNVLTNLVQGTNILAVELHNASGAGTDVAFGSALFLSRQASTVPKLNIISEDGLATLYWNAPGFGLQQLNAFSSSSASNVWVDFSGAATNSPIVIPASGTMFFQLRQ